MILCPCEVLHGQRDVEGTVLFVVLYEVHGGSLISQDAPICLPNVLLSLAPPTHMAHPPRACLRHGCEVRPDFLHGHDRFGPCNGGSIAVPWSIGFCDIVVQEFPPSLLWRLDA